MITLLGATVNQSNLSGSFTFTHMQVHMYNVCVCEEELKRELQWTLISMTLAPQLCTVRWDGYLLSRGAILMYINTADDISLCCAGGLIGGALFCSSMQPLPTQRKVRN